MARSRISQFAAGLNHKSGTADDLTLRNLLSGRTVAPSIDIRTMGFICSLACQFRRFQQESPTPIVAIQLEIKTEELYACSFTRDGRLALTGAQGTPVGVWDIETPRCLCVLEGHNAGVVNAAFGSDERRAVSCAWKGGVRVWNLSE